MAFKEEIVICECGSVEHQIIFTYDEDEYDDKEVYALIHLNKKPFWKRVSYGLKYIFGRQSNYGAFDEFIFNPKDVNKLQSLVDYLKK